MTSPFTRTGLRQSARLGLAGGALLLLVQGAAADDAGLHAFFSGIFGGSSAQSPSLPPSPADDGMAAATPRARVRSHPLTVRLRPAKPKVLVAQGPSKPVKVSIFEDRTLQPGDAVMTPRGVRIFAGSTSWPYKAADFVSIDDAKHLDKGTMSVFAALDRLPRG